MKLFLLLFTLSSVLLGLNQENFNQKQDPERQQHTRDCQKNLRDELDSCIFHPGNMPGHLRCSLIAQARFAQCMSEGGKKEDNTK